MDIVIAWLSENWFFLTLLVGASGMLLRVDRRVQKLFQTVERQERKRVEGSERTELLIKGVDATLDALHNQGHNGKVTAARDALESYAIRQAAKS